MMILSAFLSKFSQPLVQMAQDEVGMLLGIPGQIEKLGETVRDIQCVIVDAERKQSKGSAIERWLMQLKDVMYDADDIIDLCQIKAKKHLASSSSSNRCDCHMLSCFRNPFFAHQIGFKIRDINSRLEEIAKRRADLGLTESQILLGPSDQVCRVDSTINRKTDPSVVLDDIVGEKIEEDMELLVNWLTKEERSVSKNVRIAAIVGMGGIGKTTLAKKIFGHPRIQEEFQLKIWVCVSKQVKGVELLKCVIRGAKGEHGAFQERSELVPLLEKLVQGKKFLLVLDDVWEESQVVWDKLLRAPMSAGVHGSGLLVTTRDERVVNGMKATKSHRVEKLSDEDGWSLLINQVHPDGIESEIQDFMKIGMQIVKKCDGLPLAIKSIGGVLFTKGNSRDNWQQVLTSNAWSMDRLSGDIHHAFYLSYEDLPPHLKQCFIFCSIFPEDFEFDKTSLIYMWLAEGFLQDKGDIWKLGNEYYTELLLRNLLEDTHKYYDQQQCKMHDLLWAFARQLGKDENCVLWERQILSRSEVSLKVRRLSIEGNEVNSELIKKEKGLRTLLLHFEPKIALDDLCKAFSNLRILDLSCYSSNFSSLPDSLCDLVHLRYLNVSNLELRNIPNSIGNLTNLQYFCCYNCKELSHIPQSISNLHALRSLDFRNTKVEAIPTGLNNLKKLNGLYGFKPYKNCLEGFSSLDGLESLSQLGSLWLEGLERVSDRNIAKRANLGSKNQFRCIHLGYTSLSWEEQISQTNEKKITAKDVLNELFPPSSLQFLTIKYYFGSHLPNWLNLGATLPNLRVVEICDCACFERLAPLGQLPNLDFFRIIGAYSIVNVGEEFMQGDIKSRDSIIHAMSYSDIPAFPKLSQLSFVGMPNWKEWHWNKEQPAMPKLKQLFIRSCPQLRSLPEGLLHHATSLEYLDINGANRLITVENLPSIKTIRVFENPNLVRISNMPVISYIEIYQCGNLKDVENLNSLQRMALTDYEMETLPYYLTMTMPQKLIITCSEELLLKIASQENDSEWHKFKHITKVKISTMDESLYAAYQRTPFSFTTNIKLQSTKG